MERTRGWGGCWVWEGRVRLPLEAPKVMGSLSGRAPRGESPRPGSDVGRDDHEGLWQSWGRQVGL